MLDVYSIALLLFSFQDCFLLYLVIALKLEIAFCGFYYATYDKLLY